eukprot:3560090-Rhodomonas_salina.2
MFSRRGREKTAPCCSGLTAARSLDTTSADGKASSLKVLRTGVATMPPPPSHCTRLNWPSLRLQVLSIA